MRRSLLTLGVITALLLAGLTTFLRVDKLWDKNRSLLEAYTDLCFVIDVATREYRGHPPPALNEHHYQSAFERLSYHVDWKVQRFAVDRMAAWGDEVAPRLVSEFDREHDEDWKTVGQVAVALSEIGYRPAAARMVEELYDESLRDVGLERLLEAIGKIGDPEVWPALLSWFEFRIAQRETAAAGDKRGFEPPRQFYLSAGRLGATGFLLQQIQKINRRPATVGLLQGLGYTGDPKALATLETFLANPDSGLAQYASRAIDQIQASSTIESVLANFARANAFDRQRLIDTTFASQQVDNDPRVMALLSEQLVDASMRQSAANALARIDSPAAVALLRSTLEWTRPEELLAALGRYGYSHTYRLLKAFLSHQDPEVRLAAIEALVPVPDPKVNHWLSTLHDDPSAEVRTEARRALFLRDKFQLYYAIHRLLADGEGPNLEQAQERLYDWFWKTVNVPYSLGQPVAALHYVGMVLALILGVLLILNVARASELYRFHTTLHFLLASGFLGAFLVVDFGEALYRYSVGVTTLLLLGYLFMERGSHDPGRDASRFGRLAGASLWLLVPGVLFFAVPVLADSMHRAFSGARFFMLFCAFWALGLVLLLEEYLLPRHLLPRSTRVARWLAVVLSTCLLLLIAYAVLSYAIDLSYRDQDTAAFVMLMLAPLAGILCWQWWRHLSMSPMRNAEDVPELSHASLIVVRDIEMISVHLRRRRTWRERLVWFIGGIRRFYQGIDWPRRILKTAPVLLLVPVAGAGLSLLLFPVTLPLYMLVTTDWSRAELFEFIAAHVGSTILLLLVLGFARLWSHRILQIRNGYVRAGYPVMGAVLAGAYWRRRPPCDVELATPASRWLRKALQVT